MISLIWLMLGLVAGWAFLYYARSKNATGEKRILAAGLVLAAAVYVAFAVIYGSARWIAIEFAGVALYGIFAWFSYKYSVRWLAIGWVGHAAWDALLHLVGPGNVVAPEWYVLACISFDILVGGYVLAAKKQKSKLVLGENR